MISDNWVFLDLQLECGLYRGFSESNGKAICATGYTLSQLIHRGWAESHTAISSWTIDSPNNMVQDYCPSGTELVQGGWYSTSKDPPIEFLSAQEVYDVEEDSQRIR